MKNVLKKFGLSFLALVFVLSVGIFANTKTASVSAAEPFTAASLLTAGDFAVFSNTGISFTGTTPNSITGDIGVGSGVTSTAITGDFALDLPAASAFSTSVLVTGKVYARDYAVPTPAKVNQASLDLTTAYNNALVPATTVLNAGSGCGTGTCDLAGTTLVPGVYTFNVAHVIISDSMHLSGGANDVWIFQIPGTLDISSAKSILLSGGAIPANIFWAVAGTTTLETTSTFEGNILAGPATSTIAMLDGAVLHGRALGQKDVTLINNTIVIPVASSNSNISRAHSSSGSIPKNFPNTTTAPGCSAGNLFNISTGALCINNAAPEGCSGGNLFNTSTGAVCTNNAVLQIPGCGNSATGFSTSTGGSCVGNHVTTFTTTYNFGTTTLKNGSKGEAVKELQRFLNDKLSLGLVIDGSLGPKTIAVIKKWQKDNGLLDDGLVGAKTKALMNSK